MTDSEEQEKPLLLYKTAKGNHARGNFNQRQIDVVFNEILPNQKTNTAKKSVGIIAPYRLQADKLKKATGIQEIEVDTGHKYQGRERDVIILTTIANEVSVDDFVDGPNLINVAHGMHDHQLLLLRQAFYPAY